MEKYFTPKKFLLVFMFLFAFLLGGFVNAAFENAKITSEMVLQAQKITGLSFTDAEADSMLENLTRQRADFEALRKLNMPNSIVPSMNFNPIPVGYQFPDKKNGFALQKQMEAMVITREEDLPYCSVRKLGDLIRTHQFTSTAITKFFIARLKKYQPKLLFAVTITEELALEQAARADAEIKAGKYRGPLHGVPYGAKDLLAAKEYNTTWGSVPYKDQRLNEDATVISRLERAGAVLIAKTTLGELAMGDYWFGGRTRNPWNLERGSSGSSAGSASAVSAGCLPFAIGSETWGSITSPAQECGVTGLRPTFGRIPKTGAMALSWSMDKLGPIARSVEDCAIVFNTIKGTDGKDLSAIDAPFNYAPVESLKGIKIGYLDADFGANDRNRVNDSLTLVKLKSLGATLVPIQLPKLPIGAIHIMLTAECGSAFQELVLSGRDDLMVRQHKGAWPNTFRSAQFIPATEYINASRARTVLIQKLHEKIKDLDLYMASPNSDNSLATNLTGHPCVVVQNGLNSRGLPASITFIGQLFGEGKLLAVSQLYQQSTGFHYKHPDLDKTAVKN